MSCTILRNGHREEAKDTWEVTKCNVSPSTPSQGDRPQAHLETNLQANQPGQVARLVTFITSLLPHPDRRTIRPVNLLADTMIRRNERRLLARRLAWWSGLQLGAAGHCSMSLSPT